MKVFKKIIVSVLVLSFMLFLLFFVLRSRIEEYVINSFDNVASKYLGYEFKFSKIDFNSITHIIEVDNVVAVNTRNNTKVLVDKIIVDLNISDILLKKIRFNTILLQKPRIYINSDLNLPNNDKLKKELSKGFLDFYIAKLHISDCKVFYKNGVDSIVSPEFSFSTTSLSNKFKSNDRNGFELDIADSSGLSIKWIGNSRGTKNSTGIISIDNFNIDSSNTVHKLNNFLPSALRLDSAILNQIGTCNISTKLSVSAVYDVSLDDSLFFDIRKGRLELNDFQFIKDSISVRAQKLLVENIQFSSLDRVINAPKLIVKNLKLLLASEDYNLDEMFSVKNYLLQKSVTGWKYDLKMVDINNLHIYNTRSLFHNVSSPQLKLKVEKSKIVSRFNLFIGDNLEFNTKIDLSKNSNKVDVIFKKIDLSDKVVKDIILKNSGIDIVNGSSSGDINIVFADSFLSDHDIKINSNFNVQNMVSQKKGELFFDVVNAKVSKLIYTKNNFSIRRIDLYNPKSAIDMRKQVVGFWKIINLNSKLQNKINELKSFQVDSVLVNNGSFYLSDERLFNQYRILTENMNGYLLNCSNKGQARFNLKGFFDEHSNIQFFGNASLFTKTPKLHFEVDIFNLELTTFQHEPFVYGGYEILKGLVDLRAFYFPNRDGSLGRRVDVKLYKTQIGEKLYESDIKLPISMGNLMLSDKNGDLDFSFKIYNKLGKTNIEVADYILKAFSNTLVTTFLKIGKMFQTEQKVVPIQFEANDYSLSIKSKKTLDLIAEYLLKNENLLLNIEGGFDESKDKLHDPEEFFQQLLLDKIDVQFDDLTRDIIVKKYKNEFIYLYNSITNNSYKNSGSPSSITLIGMYNRLINSRNIQVRYLRNLAVLRAKSAKDYLVKKHGLKRNRIFVRNTTMASNCKRSNVVFEIVK